MGALCNNVAGPLASGHNRLRDGRLGDVLAGKPLGCCCCRCGAPVVLWTADVRLAAGPPKA